MNWLVLGSSKRTIGNFLPVLKELRKRGDEIDLVWIPLSATEKLDGAAQLFTHVLIAPSLASSDLPSGSPFWNGVVALHRERGYRAVLMDDMNHWPSHTLCAALEHVNERPLVFAFQHGLYQSWNVLNKSFCADYFLCFGRRHVLNFDQHYWPRVLPCGLPKLDALKDVRTCDDQHILYFAQSAPASEIILPLLRQLSAETSLRVRLRPHPGHPLVYQHDSRDIEIVETEEDPITSIARCTWLLTTHSTAVLEAIHLGKPAVALPSFGLTDFSFYPGISTDFLAEKVLAALKKVRSDTAGLERFLRETCGGRRYDSTSRTLQIIDALVEERPSRGRPGIPSKVMELVQDHHPSLCESRPS